MRINRLNPTINKKINYKKSLYMSRNLIVPTLRRYILDEIMYDKIRFIR